MTKLLIAMATLALFFAHAEAQETVLESKVSTFDYASVKADGGLQVQHAWEGYRIIRRADGSCVRVTHTNLRIEEAGPGQRAVFDEDVVPESCC